MIAFELNADELTALYNRAMKKYRDEKMKFSDNSSYRIWGLAAEVLTAELLGVETFTGSHKDMVDKVDFTFDGDDYNVKNTFLDDSTKFKKFVIIRGKHDELDENIYMTPTVFVVQDDGNTVFHVFDSFKVKDIEKHTEWNSRYGNVFMIPDLTK
jgi:hypothetical protein